MQPKKNVVPIYIVRGISADLGDSIEIDGVTYAERRDIDEQLKKIYDADPNVRFLISPKISPNYNGIGRIIYSSGHVGVPFENLLLTMDDGKIIQLADLEKVMAERNK